MSQSIYIQDGNTIDFIATAAHAAGDIVSVGAFIGQVVRSVKAGEPAALRLTGVVEVSKPAATAITMGQSLYWDPAAAAVTTTAGSLKLLGQSVQAVAANAAATVRVRLVQSIT